jgi:hypothetical protein
MSLPEKRTDSDMSPVVDDRDAGRQMVGYTTKLLVQALFPYRKPTADKIVSFDGATRITISSSDGLPYGKYPRLIMAFIMTEAVKRRDLPIDEARRIPLGRSMNEFLANMGLKSRGTGGARGTIGLLRTQLRRLVGTNLKAERMYRSTDVTRDSGGNLAVAESWDLWFDNRPDQQTFYPSYLELTRQFFREIAESPIPLDLNILRALTRPRSMDIYIWLTMRRFSLNHPVEVDWDRLQVQFGPETLRTGAGVSDFRRRFREAVADVLEQWPDAGVSFTSNGLLLQPGEPSIARKPSRRRLQSGD